MTDPHRTAAHRTGAPPKRIDGIEWTCWKVGLMQHHWRALDGRLVAADWTHRATSWATVDGVMIGDRYRSLETAMRAAGKALRRQSREVQS